GGRDALEKQLDYALQEARTIVPGAQALVGFQLIAGLTPGFARLDPLEHVLHVVGLALLAIALVCLLTPAAYHRHAAPGEATPRLVWIASSWITLAMGFLGLALAVDVHIAIAAATESSAVAAATALAFVAVAGGCWFVWPRLAARRMRRERLSVSRSR